MLKGLTRLLGRSGAERFVSTGIVEPPNVVQSLQGRYSVGRTGLLQVATGNEALVLLLTPPKSTHRSFVVSITITSNRGRRAVVYFGAETPLPVQVSQKVALTHRGVPLQPQTTIQMVTDAVVPLSAGVGLFQRLLVGKETLVLEQEGRIILEPGEALGVWFESIRVDDEIDVAFGWWEEPLDEVSTPRPR